MRNWWERPQVVVAVNEWATDNGEFIAEGDIHRFFEKPWSYPELFAAWAAEQGCPEGEEMAWLDGASNPANF